MLKALHERGIAPDMIIGSSVGAINGAWLAGHPDTPISELAATWTSLSRSNVFPAKPVAGLAGFVGMRRGLVPSGRLRRLVETNLNFTNIEDAAVPFHAIVTEVLGGIDRRLSSGDAATAVMASAAIPGVFAPVEIDGIAYMDGGVLNNTPISHAVELGADPIWVLPTGWSCSLAEPPHGALGMALHGLDILVQQRLAPDVARFTAAGADIRVVPPPCPITVSPADFRQSAILIEHAYQVARKWLTSGDRYSRALELTAPHSHG
jgi:NTE family protein